MTPKDDPRSPHHDDVVDRRKVFATPPLPVQLTSFIGREREMEEVKKLLILSRLVTLTGTGGCGKTRLALRISSDLLDTYADGIYWVDLAPLADATLLPQAIANVLNIGEPSGRPLLNLILDLLHDKCLLLVLDNCEHLASACADFAHDLLCDAPRIRILATSREPLAVIGEVLYPVAPLSLPPKSQVTDLAQFDSIQLFVERARSVLPDFILTSTNSPSVASICRRLDGIPLAIELASTRINTLTVEQIAERLDDRFTLLTSAQHGVPSHHRTLRAALDWSYDSLSTNEQILLCRLSVFSGGCTLDAVEHVCAGDGITPEPIVDGLSSLLNKSLVVAETLEREEVRYWMLETIRQYARDKLFASDEGIAIRDRHLDYFLKFAMEIDPKLHSTDQNEWLDRLDRDHDNLRAALAWSLGDGRVEKGLQLAAALMWFWEMRTYWSEARQQVKMLLNQPEATPRTLARANALLVVVSMGGFGGINKSERPYAEELIAIAREHGAAGKRVLAAGLAQLSHMIFDEDPLGAIAKIDEGLDAVSSVRDEWLVAYLLMLKGWYSRYTKDDQSALKSMEQSLARFKSLGDNYWAGLVSGVISFVYYKQGDLARARQEIEKLLPIVREIRDRRAVSSLLCWLGDIERVSGKYDSAKRYYAEYLEIAHEIDDKLHIFNGMVDLGFVLLHENDLNGARLLFAETLELGRELGFRYIKWALFGFASLAAAEMNFQRAIRLYAVTDSLFQEDHLLASQADGVEHQRYLTFIRDHVDGETINRAWAEGRALTMEQAIAEAEQEIIAPPSAPALSHELNPLTPREVEVLRLVAAGLSDAQVAAKLVISRRTVSTHLTAIYGKLGVTSRSAATRYALDHSLI